MRSFDTPKVYLVGITPNPLEVLFLGAKICFMNKDRDGIMETYTIEKAEKMIKSIISMGHLSVLEHVTMNFYIEDVSRSFMAQLTRHRLASFLVQSQHYQNYEDFSFKELELYPSEECKRQYHMQMEMINGFYASLIRDKVPHYIAREILPNAAGVRMLFTANIRELRHIIQLRITKNNTPEIIEFSKILLQMCYENIPSCFEDLQQSYSQVP